MASRGRIPQASITWLVLRPSFEPLVLSNCCIITCPRDPRVKGGVKVKLCVDRNQLRPGGEVV